jgi:hypothetical protein
MFIAPKIFLLDVCCKSLKTSSEDNEFYQESFSIYQISPDPSFQKSLYFSRLFDHHKGMIE